MADDGISLDNFTRLSTKITQLLYARPQNNRNLIKTTLDELNAINYRYITIKNPTKAVLLVNQCCTMIPPDDQQLVVACCQLIKTLVNVQNVVIEGRTLNIAINWCLEALTIAQNYYYEILSGLDCLLRMDKQREALKDLVQLDKLLDLSQSDNAELLLMALKCLEGAIVPPLDSKRPTVRDFDEEFRKIFEIFIKYLQNCKNIENPTTMKTITVCLLGLQHITRQKSEITNENLSLILGIIRTYILFGIIGIRFIQPEKITPSTLTIPEPVSFIADKKSGKAIRRRRQRNPAVEKRENFDDLDCDSRTFPTVEMTELSLTSESDYSDLESGENLSKLSMQVRQAALGLFMDVIRVGPRGVIFSYWSTFIPENPSTNKHSLVSCILKDPTSKGRLAALNTLLLLLTSSRSYLKLAEKGEHLSFTPFSIVIGFMINELHKSLITALKERHIPVLAQVLKCLVALVQATPYHKLQSGLITSVINNVKPLIYHQNSTIQVTSLIVLGACLSIEPILLEIKQILIDDNDDNRDGDSLKSSWVVDRCLLNLGFKNDRMFDNNTPTAVQMESLQLLSIISRHYYDSLLITYLDSLSLCLLTTINDKYSDVRFHTVRTIDSICQIINSKLINDNLVIKQKMLDLWMKLLDGPLIDTIQSEQYPALRRASCDCLASIGDVTYENLPRNKQILCITLLLNCNRDEDDCVRSIAVRALGLYIFYQPLRADVGFVVDTTEIIYRLLNDKSVSVRTKAAWSLANVCEALVSNKNDLNLDGDFPDALLLKLLKSTNLLVNDNDRIKMNIVRALGGLLQLITDNLINNDEFNVEIQQAIENLVKCSTTGWNMKVRWNSCYALKNMMKNPILFTTNFNWQQNVFNILLDLAMNFSNFKVRICATSALGTPNNRNYYNDHYQNIWNGLCKALENAENMENCSEYDHRDHLVDEICLTIGHLITLLTIDDLILIEECVMVNLENLTRQIRKVWDRLLPEKSTVLFNANTHITDLLTNDKAITNNQKLQLQQLQEIIKQDF